jgi:hypothetical protein
MTFVMILFQTIHESQARAEHGGVYFVIPVTQEVEAGRSPDPRFKVKLDNIGRPCIKNKQTKNSPQNRTKNHRPVENGL